MYSAIAIVLNKPSHTKSRTVSKRAAKISWTMQCGMLKGALLVQKKNLRAVFLVAMRFAYQRSLRIVKKHEELVNDLISHSFAGVLQ